MVRGRVLELSASARVISFSAIRPTSLSFNTVLRLEARGMRAEVFGERQKEALRTLGGRLTRRRAVCLLLFDDVNFTHLRCVGRAGEQLHSGFVALHLL